MTHPSTLELAGWVDGTTSAGIEAHVRACEVCQRESNRLRAIASSLHGAVDRVSADSSFVNDLGARIEAAAPRRPLFLIAAAGALGLAVLVLPAYFEGPSEFTARGTSSSDGGSSAVGLDFFAHAPGAPSRLLQPGASVSSSEGFAFVVRTDRPVELMLLGLDAVGEVHWFYPAFVDAGTNPQSVSLMRSQPLSEVVAPEGAAPGHFELVAIFSDDPLSVSHVEQMLADGGIEGLRKRPRLLVKTIDVLRE